MKYIIFLLSSLLIIEPALAGVMPSRSRVIFKEEDRNQTLMLVNTNNYPVIVQTWVDNGEGTPEVRDIPFLTVQPVFHLDTSAIKGISIMYNNTPLPEDRESLYWLNILEIPPQKKSVNADNKILVGLNMQIKLFYRPKKIVITPEDAVKKIQCKIIINNSFQCHNPSPIHISGIAMTDSSINSKLLSENNDFLFKPFESKIFTSPHIINSTDKLKLTYINDYGDQITESIL